MACHPESPCSSASASSQELDDQSTDEITQSFATTTLDSSPSDHNSHNPLLSLPDEILGSALSYLKNNDHLSLQLTSRRLFQCSSISVKDLDATEHEAFSTTMKREAYHAAESEEAAGNRSSIRRPCGVCIDVHPIRHFSATQLMRSASKRGCLRSERKLVICEHMSTTLLELTTQVTSEIGCLEHGAREQQIKQYMCLHPDHRDHNITVGRTVYPTLELKLGGQGPVLASVTISAEIFLSSDTFDVLDGDADDKHARRIRKRMRRCAVRMCPHTSTASEDVYERFDYISLWEMDSAGTRARGGGCRYPGCSMRFWLIRGPVRGCGRKKRKGNIWLRVRRSVLDLPLRAEDQDWLACSMIDGFAGCSG